MAETKAPAISVFDRGCQRLHRRCGRYRRRTVGAGAQHRNNLGLRQSRPDRFISPGRGGRANDHCGA